MFYYLPNNQPVDVEGAVDAMLCTDERHRHFLDIETGEVACVEAHTKTGKEKLEALAKEGARYRALPRVPHETRTQWFEEFVNSLVMSENKMLAAKLRKTLRTEGLERAVHEAENEEWDFDIWAGDRAFEDLGVWLTKEVPGFTKGLRGCGDCAICRAQAGGAGLDELREAFEEQRQIDEDESDK